MADQRLDWRTYRLMDQHTPAEAARWASAEGQRMIDQEGERLTCGYRKVDPQSRVIELFFRFPCPVEVPDEDMPGEIYGQEAVAHLRMWLEEILRQVEDEVIPEPSGEVAQVS